LLRTLINAATRDKQTRRWSLITAREVAVITRIAGPGSKCLGRVVCASLFSVLLLLPAALFSQGYFGTVSGEVTDTSGAVVPGAKVVLIDQVRGFTFNTTSDSSGRYLFTSVPPGTYSVSVEMPGFAKEVRTNITVTAGGNATANLTLRVASARQTVQVTGQAAALDTEDAVTGNVVNRRFLADLPLVDRYVLDFTQLGPGMNLTDDQDSVSDTGTDFNSNGSRAASADILLDGASITNFEPNGGITNVTYTPSEEAIEEMVVAQTNFSAEYGFTGSTVVNMITQSGTNRFHGSVYDYIRNQMTDANDWFNNVAGVPIPPVHRNNYGGTFGGPIKKNKAFFFFDWDGTRQSTMSTYQAGVPTVAERNGDFSGLCGAYGGTFNSVGLCSVAAGQIWDPYTGTYQTPANEPAGAYRSAYIPFNNIATYTSPGNPVLNGTPFQLPQAPGNLIDPVGQKMMSYFPMPNYSGGGIYDNWTASGASLSANDQFDLKVDYQLNEQNLISVKYSEDWTSGTPYDCFKNFTDPCGSGPDTTGSQLAAINYTKTISPTLLLTSTLGFTRGTENILAYNKSLNSNPLGTLGFPSYLDSNGFQGVPAMFIGNYYSAAFTSMGQDPYGNYVQGQDTGQWTETLTNMRGNHELKFGFEGQIHQQNYIQTNAPLGYFTIGSGGSSQCPTPVISVCGGDSLASFMMGQFTDFYEIQDRPATENFQYAGYAQDNWKVIPKLTLNLGLRYEVALPLTERYNRMNSFDPNVVNPLNGGSISYVNPLTGQNETTALMGGEVFVNSNDRTNRLTDWSEFQPRFGLAYLFHNKTVIRGGYGIYYDPTRSGANGLISYGSEGYNQYTTPDATYENNGATPYMHFSNPFPYGLMQSAGSSLGLLNDVGYGAVGPIKNSFYARVPYEQSWSFGFERQLPSNMLLSAYYVGKKGTDLYYEGANALDTLGPSIEKLSSNEIGNLSNYVSNPFASLLTSSYYADSPLSAPTIPAYQLLLPYPEYTSVTSDEPPIANSIYNALQFTLSKSYSNGLQLAANYTWSKSIDDSSIYDTNVAWLASTTSELYMAQDPNNLEADRSLSTFDVPQNLKINYTYDLPFGRGRALLNNMPRPLELILGGWRTAGIWGWQSGYPLAFIASGGGTPIPTYGYQRPNQVCTPQRTGGPDGNWANNYFANPNCFQLPAPYTLGDMPRATGDVRSPSIFSSDLSLAKDFGLSSKHESLKLELRLDAENAFNHPVFGTPDVGVGDPTFGVISYTNTNVPPRELQLSAKFSF
jgi:Carboxypeptidase regulatory-like domain/TonB dependent receptor